MISSREFLDRSMTQTFTTIAITGKPEDTGVTETISRIADHLLQRGHEVVADADIVPADAGLECVARAELAERCDLIISVGGDGTLLTTARLVVERDVPVLGVNRGRLGFLVDVSPSNLSELDRVLDGDYIEDDRALLRAEIVRDDQILASGIALNDVVLYKWNTARMIEFTTYVNGELLTTHRADGIIISTPTGSTAYAMASGGPIVHPSVNAMGLLPISPHTLSNRPLIIGADCELAIEVTPDVYGRAGVSCDGQDDLGLRHGARLIVKQHARRVRIIHPSRYRYFDILRAKLRWGDTNLR